MDRPRYAPRLARIEALVQSLAGRHIQVAGVRRQRQHAVDVRVEPAQHPPASPAVGALQYAPHLDAGVDGVGIGRVEAHVFDVAAVRPRGKEPLVHCRRVAQARQFGPVLTQVVAHVQVGRLHASVQSHLPTGPRVVHRPHPRLLDARVPPFPGAAVVRAHVQPCVLRPCKQQPMRRLARQRVDLLLVQRPSRLVPGSPWLLARQAHDALDGADQDLPRRRVGRRDGLAADRQIHGHCSPLLPRSAGRRSHYLPTVQRSPPRRVVFYRRVSSGLQAAPRRFCSVYFAPPGVPTAVCYLDAAVGRGWLVGRIYRRPRDIRESPVRESPVAARLARGAS